MIRKLNWGSIVSTRDVQESKDRKTTESRYLPNSRGS